MHLPQNGTIGFDPQPYCELPAAHLTPMSATRMMPPTFDEVDSLLAEVRAGIPCQPERDWYSCRDCDLIFNSAGTAVFVSDMYTAMNAAVLQSNNIHIVVNMLGAANLVDQRRGFWGPRYQWDADKTDSRYKRLFHNCLSEDFQQKVEEEYMQDQAAFYRQLGIEYVEEATADGRWNVIERHFPRVIQSLRNHMETVRSRPAPSATVNILFHCYGGRNRSTAAAVAFTYAQAKGEEVRMVDLIAAAIRARPTVLMKGKDNHRNFLRALLSFADTVDL